MLNKFFVVPAILLASQPVVPALELPNPISPSAQRDRQQQDELQELQQTSFPVQPVPTNEVPPVQQDSCQIPGEATGWTINSDGTISFTRRCAATHQPNPDTMPDAR